MNETGGTVTSKRPRVALVDFLKAAAICFVIVNHSGLLDENRNPVYLLTIDKAVPVFMMLSGYVLAMTWDGKAVAKLFRFGELKRKFLRLTIPTIITYFFCVVLRFVMNHPMAPDRIVKDFILGYYGQGAYYYGLMVQFLLVGPLILLIMRVCNAYGVIICGLLNLVYDVCCSSFGLNHSYYRILIFRYILFISLFIICSDRPMKTLSFLQEY